MDDLEKTSIAIGIPPEEGKFCADCKHLVGIRHRPEEVDRWNCGHPENSAWEKPNLITGVKNRIFLRNLTTLRYPDPRNTQLCADVCGSEGKWYEKYEKPTYHDDPLPQPKAKEPEYKPQTMKPSALKNLKLGSDL